MNIFSKIFKKFTNDGIDIFDEPISDFSFKDYFDQHIDDVRKTVSIKEDLNEDTLHFCFVVAQRLHLNGLEPYESVVESCKYYSDNPDCDKSIDFENIEKIVSEIFLGIKVNQDEK